MRYTYLAPNTSRELRHTIKIMDWEWLYRNRLCSFKETLKQFSQRPCQRLDSQPGWDASKSHIQRVWNSKRRAATDLRIRYLSYWCARNELGISRYLNWSIHYPFGAGCLACIVSWFHHLFGDVRCAGASCASPMKIVWPSSEVSMSTSWLSSAQNTGRSVTLCSTPIIRLASM